MRRLAPPASISLLFVLSGCSGEQSILAPASSDAGGVATLWWGMAIFATAAFLLVIGLLAKGIFVSRRRGDARPLTRSQAWTLVVSGGIALPVVAILIMIVTSLTIGGDGPAGADGRKADLTVEVTGHQWWWEVRYLDDDGNPIATTANEIHLPVGREARLLLKSADVIHSFWVPNLQGKTDMVPGTTNATWLRPREAGTYRGQCAEFCGTQHTFMAFLVVAQPPAEFRDWLTGQAAPASAAQTETEARGLEAFLGGGCADCHTIRGTAADGTRGPDLTHLASRRTLGAATIPNTRGHLGGWILDPQHVKPGNHMPPSQLPPRDFQALLDYLGSLE